MTDNSEDGNYDDRFDTLIKQSSLGTASARALGEHVPLAQVEFIRRFADLLEMLGQARGTDRSTTLSLMHLLTDAILDDTETVARLLEILHEAGMGEELIALLTTAAVDGDAGAMNNIGLLLAGHDPAEVRRWFERAANADDASGAVLAAGGSHPRHVATARSRQDPANSTVLLERINSPKDLKGLSQGELTRLAAEIRDVLIGIVTRTSGHLGPNLGIVELTIAIHRVFDSPRDRIVFDSGHQAYVHKLLTGRAAAFGTLRQRGGLAGYPSRAESEHDLVENSHASTSLSYAGGLAKAYALRGERDRTVVAVIGDGALTGGMAWEALNNIAADKDSRLVIIVNDNGRSYQPTVGGLAEHLASIRVSERYENVLDYIKTTLTRAPLIGGALHGIKKGIRDVLQPQVMFEDLGIKYVGPIDGHDEQLLEHVLRSARDFGGPMIVHAVTKKGFGYPVAEQNEVDCLHQVPAAGPMPGTWTGVFSDEMLAIGKRRPDVVAITAAMLHPTGLGQFAASYPDRVYDVGIAEQHAVTSAAGLAMGGLHPVVAIYSTFLNRAFDQALMDVALHQLPVTFVLDRAGVTGPDGPSHHGMWDGSIMQLIPGMKIAAPRDASRLAELLNEAVDVPDGPTVVRFPKGKVGGEVEAIEKLGGMDVLRTPAAGLAKDVLLVGAGPMAVTGLEVADLLADHGIGVTVVDPRWTKPVDEALIGAAQRSRLVVTIEDNGRVGGFGDAVARLLRDHDVSVPVKTFGLPQEFLAHGTRNEVLEEAGLTSQQLAQRITDAVAYQAPRDFDNTSKERPQRMRSSVQE